MKTDLRTIFLSESHGLLKRLQEGLSGAQRDAGRLAELFRCAHMLKGNVRLAGITELEELVTPASEVLKTAKDSGGLSSEDSALLREAMEAAQALVEGLEGKDFTALRARLETAARRRRRQEPATTLRLLLIEDSQLQSRLIEKALDETGATRFSVERAESLEAGLRRASQVSFDAALLDLNLPDSQGVESFSRLVARFPDLPIVVLTVSDDDATAVEALRRGAQDYLVKREIDSSLLSRVVRYAIERMRVRQSLRKAHEELETKVRERTRELTRANDALLEKSAALQRSNTELGLFASIAAHELQEPLRKIVAWGDLLKRNAAPVLGQTELEYLERMRAAALRQAEIINSIRELTRVTTAGAPMSEIDLGEVVGDAVADASAALEPFGGRVELRGTLPRIRGDALQLGRLFSNLLANAVKYRCKDRPPIVAIVSKPLPGPAVEITVSDNGVGFDPKFAGQLFQPFQRLHRREEYEGMGMGLAICARIAWRHGGAISARSELGKGSVFTVTLPLGGGAPVE